MKTRTKYFMTIVSLTIICACTMKQRNDITKADWLIGTWENRTPGGNIYETWNRESDNEFSGMSYIVQEQDTVLYETIRFVQEQDGLFYIPVVKNQNEGLSVRFATKTISDTLLVFENPQHDFPQIISYTQINSDSLVAEISGTKNGEERRQVFPMKRIK